MEDEQEITWKGQFINACMLHPTKNEDGEIVDFEFMDGLLHFICIGWKIFFSIVFSIWIKMCTCGHRFWHSNTENEVGTDQTFNISLSNDHISTPQ